MGSKRPRKFGNGAPKKQNEKIIVHLHVFVSTGIVMPSWDQSSPDTERSFTVRYFPPYRRGGREVPVWWVRENVAGLTTLCACGALTRLCRRGVFPLTEAA